MKDHILDLSAFSHHFKENVRHLHENAAHLNENSPHLIETLNPSAA
jgi:hypothetical protein